LGSTPLYGAGTMYSAYAPCGMQANHTLTVRHNFTQMKRHEDTFQSNLDGLDFETIENSPHSIFGLSNDLKLIYFNKAWFEFAKLNNGEPEISERFTIGTPFENALSGKMKDFYISNYKKVLSDLKVWKHEYECSSPTLYRVFCQDVYPLKNAAGIVVVNSLKTERTFDHEELKNFTLSNNEYVDKNGFITLCTNCRKTQRVNNVGVWDWVPDFVYDAPKNASHSICVICYDYYWKHR
jgi:hypothetical protein